MAPDATRQNALTRLAPVPPEYAAAWARVSESAIEDRMRRALLRIVYGSSCREAAREEGYASHQDVARYARSFGLLNASKDRLLNGARRVAQLSQDELEERLSSEPEAIGSKDLAIIAGIAIDKVARAEGWERADRSGGDYLSVLDRIAERIRGAGISLKLEVSSPSQADLIDVTPPK